MSSASTVDVCAYSDESSEGLGRSSWGYVLQVGGIVYKKGHGILHRGKVFDAEISSATIALGVALSMRQDGEKIFVLLENQVAVMALQTGKLSASIQLTNLFHNLVKAVEVEFRWVLARSLKY